jgi:carbon storage regulator
MLVLSRKLGEKICIGSGIQVTVLGIQKGRVRLGLAAPQELPIHRQEVCRGIGFASPHGDGTQPSSGMKVA